MFRTREGILLDENSSEKAGVIDEMDGDSVGDSDVGSEDGSTESLYLLEHQNRTLTVCVLCVSVCMCVW